MATKKTTKRHTTKRAAKRRTTKNQPMRSFRIAKQPTPFMTVKATKQTLYWGVICVIVIVFTLWILKLQSDIQAIYDSIDANDNTVMTLPPAKHHK